MANYSKEWAFWCKERRKQRRLTRRELAKIVKIDPSYVTLIERDGYIPLRDKVQAIGRVFGDEQAACLLAGLLPDKMTPAQFQKLALGAQFETLSSHCKRLVRALATLPSKEQDQLTYAVRKLLGVA